MTSLLQKGDLTDCERQLWRAVETGELVDLRSGNSELDDPDRGAEWGPERAVRSELLYELLVEYQPTSRAVVLRGARISGGLNLEAARIACSLIFEGCFFAGPINLREAQAPAVRITGCKLLCLAADQLETRGDLDLGRSTVPIVTLRGAHLGGNLILDGSALTGGSWPLDLAEASLIPPADGASGQHRKGAMALVADGLRIDRDLRMEGLTTQGEMLLRGAYVGGQLVLRGANLTNEHGTTLTADRLTVNQSMFCQDGFTAQGELCLNGAHIVSQLVFDGASLNNESGTALDLYEAKVAESLSLVFSEPPKGFVMLNRAEVGAVHDSKKTWPSKLGIRGFRYDHLESSPKIPVKERLAWLRLDPAGYAPQPYEQLVALYRRTGNEHDARRVAIEKQRRRRDELSPPAKAWSLFLGATVGHGYRPWLAAVWLLVLVGAGWVAFDSAYPKYFTAAPEYGGTPHFQPLLYTLDLVLPVINLHQRDAWIAQGPAQWGVLLTIAGWVLATVWVSALTGLLKKD